MPAFPGAVAATRRQRCRFDVQRLQQALVTEYDTGVTIGWHRDKPMFEDVVALSFLSTCRLRLRRKDGARWERWSTEIAPRSIYRLSGARGTNGSTASRRSKGCAIR